MSLLLDRVVVSYGAKTVLRNAGFTAVPERITALVGPNGTGKSTLLRALFGLLPYSGKVYLNGKGMNEIAPDKRSEAIRYMPQDANIRAALTVLEVVLLGRLKSLAWRVDKQDIRAALAKLEQLGIDGLAQRYMDELSGGQRQLVMLAQTLMGNPALLLLDEPTSALDLRHQLEILEIVERVTRDRGIVTLMAIHDLSLAARYCGGMVMLHEGIVAKAGTPEQVLTAGRIAQVYGVEVEVEKRRDGSVRIYPIRPRPFQQTEPQGNEQSAQSTVK